jgi:hypothetical protein
MDYAELIETLQQLPEDKQAEVLDFAQFLAQKAKKDEPQVRTLAQSSMARWINNPLGVDDFKPLSREEANAR